MLKIATWNVNSINVRLQQTLDFLQQENIDILALQETKVPNEKFPINAFKELGYHVIFSGQKSFNGMAIISRVPAEEIITDIPTLEDPQRRILVATINNIRVINLYIPNGESVTSEKFPYKLNWLTKVTEFIREQLKIYPQVVVLGDYNIAPENRDVYDPQLWEGQVLFTSTERAAFQTILQTGLQDAFRLFSDAGENYTWWHYRQGAFWLNWGLRIDHILVSEALAKICQSCVIAKNLRKLQRPSDHAAVLAVFK